MDGLHLTLGDSNGYLMGSFLASDPLKHVSLTSPRFILGSLGWLIGLLGNGELSPVFYTPRVSTSVLRPFRFPSALQSTTTRSSTTSVDNPVSSPSSAYLDIKHQEEEKREKRKNRNTRFQKEGYSRLLLFR